MSNNTMQRSADRWGHVMPVPFAPADGECSALHCEVEMNGWTRSDLIALIGVIVAVLIFVGQEFLRRSKSSRAKGIIIQTPQNQEAILIRYGEERPIRRDVVGIITGFTPKQIEQLGLYVEVSIQTDRWYLQGKSPVQADGSWKVASRFGGTRHIIKAELKDSNGVKYKTKEIEVAVSS